MYEIRKMCLYFLLDAPHVSYSLVYHQERRFGAVYRNWYKPVPYVWLLSGYSHTTARRIGIYQMRRTAYKSYSC